MSRVALKLIQRLAWSVAALAVAVTFAAAQVSAQVCALAGRDGPVTISGVGNVVNTYFPGAASASAGATSVQLGAMRAGGASTSISTGDLLLVIQTQDGTFNSTNGTAYGANNGTGRGLTALGGAGSYEYVVATSNSSGGGAVSVRGAGAGNGLVNAYTFAAPNTIAGGGAQGQRRFQIIRVPQYSSMSLSGTITAPAWNGSTGGVVAFDVAGTLAMSGGATVNVNGLGFRGGGGRALVGGRAVAGGGNPAPGNNDYSYLSSSPSTATNGAHGSKAEGILGTPRYVYNPATGALDELNPTAEGYPNGSTARGAPGNAGGGGTDSDAAGVNQENSGGGGGANGGDGGRGGNTWNANAATNGLGGVAVANTATRVVMGGGGGAGSRNNSVNVDSSGASGGGIILVRANAISGGGTFTANGNNALNNTANDGGGGGGAGGAVIVTAAGSLAGLTVNAGGGRGGDAWLVGGTTPADRHGPGGGGGGGFVAHTGGAAASVTGGAHGVTTTLSDAYNSTDGASGVILSVTQSQMPGADSGAECVPALTVTKTTSTATVNNTSAGTTAAYTITVANAANRSPATGASVSDTLPAGFTYASTGTVNLAGGATRSPTTNPTAGDAVPAWGLFSVPAGGQVAITFTVAVAASVAGGTYQNPATFTYLDPRRTTNTGTTTAGYDPASSAGEDVAVIPPPNVELCKTFPGQTCDPAPTLPPQLPGADITYLIIFTNKGGTAARNLVLTDPLPTNTDFKVGSAAANLGTTGLTVTFFYSYDNGATFVATAPVSGAGGAPAGYDRTVTHVRWAFTGNLSQAAPANTGSVQFVTRIR